MNQSQPKYRFVESGVPDLLNSEGPCLKLVAQIYQDTDGIENSRLWLRAHLKSGSNLFARVNEAALSLFFQGRLSVAELFALRRDEPFVLEEVDGRNRTFRERYYSEAWWVACLEVLPYAHFHYYGISEGVRLSDPWEQVMKKLDLYWANSHEHLPVD
jgi:hypothetical protein